MTAPYCTPSECGKASEARAVGTRLAHLLDHLGYINRWVCEGPAVEHCERFANHLRRRLRAEGWRVTIRGERWQVLPPRPQRRPARRPARRLAVWTVQVTIRTGTGHGLAWSGSVDVAAVNSGSAMMAAREKLKAEVCPELWLLTPPPEVQVERMLRKEPRP
jgi:hypothetical protein